MRIGRSAPAIWRASNRATRLAFALAALACGLGFAALATEACISFGESFAKGRGAAEATFLYLRYFTITTNIGLCWLHGTTAFRLARGRRLPAGRVYDAALVYAAVTAATYELLLRASWSPQGAEFLSDLMLHDVVPLLTLAIWLLAAPRTGVGWRDPLVMLVYPATYLVVTLVAGATGEGYPYDFLSVAKIGLGRVLLVSLAFLALFLMLGGLATALAKRLAADPGDGFDRRIEKSEVRGREAGRGGMTGGSP